MWIAYLIVAIVGLAGLVCIIVSSYNAGYQKAKVGKIKDLGIILGIIGGVILCVCIFVFWLTTRIDLMRQCLNQPITSEMQLYGYKILNKKHFKEKVSFDSPEKSRYYISISRVLPPFWMFCDVKVSEKFYNEKVKKGKSYLPESELDELIPQEPNEPNEPSKQKAETNVSAFLFEKLNKIITSCLHIRQTQLIYKHKHIHYHTSQ